MKLIKFACGVKIEVRPLGRQTPHVAHEAPQHLLIAAHTTVDLVGTLQLSFLPGLARRGSWRAQIEAVRVAAPLRGSGLGTAMVGWSIEAARQHGCSLVQLTTDKRRFDAHRFYERLGFAASHEGMKLTL